jgi:peptidoglycan/xylan/chitin deacetylase (PgdA/CDA1 family)
VTFDDAYSGVAEYAFPILKKYGFGAAVYVVTDQTGGTNEWDQKSGSTTLRCMSADQIRHWAEEGIEFGAHTRTHADLRAHGDAELIQEIQGSMHFLSDLLGRPVDSFAYPYGHYPERAKKIVEQTFDLAFTRDEGLNGLYTDPFLLRRITVLPDDTLADLAFLMRLGSSPLRRLKHLHKRFGTPVCLVRQACRAMARQLKRLRTREEHMAGSCAHGRSEEILSGESRDPTVRDECVDKC